MRVRVLITVKTYPSLSTKYDELVCTAGFDEDGNWIRLFPIPFRKLDYEKRYKKYQWIELDVIKNPEDFRPESFRPIDTHKMVLGETVEPDGAAWVERRKYCLKRVFQNKKLLLDEAQDPDKRTSLAVFKPSKVLEFIVKPTEKTWDPKKLAALKSRAQQTDLFAGGDNPFEAVGKVPYKFSYKFLDDDGVESTLMIEDWETGMLYWNSLKRHEGNQAKACEDVRKKYFTDFARTKDLSFFLGTTLEHHAKNAPNPFVIVGTFHPGHILKPSLFDSN